MSSCPCNSAASPGISRGATGLPFSVDFQTGSGATAANQSVCNTNMCLLPNGPIIPTRPVFPSALPSEFRPSTTNVDTNYLNVKRIACICNLRCNCLSVDDGGNQTGSTNVSLVNLPSADAAGPGDTRLLVVDALGKVYTKAEPVAIEEKSYRGGASRVKTTKGGGGGYDTDDSHINMHESDLVQRAIDRITKMYTPGGGATNE